MNNKHYTTFSGLILGTALAATNAIAEDLATSESANLYWLPDVEIFAQSEAQDEQRRFNRTLNLVEFRGLDDIGFDTQAEPQLVIRF